MRFLAAAVFALLYIATGSAPVNAQAKNFYVCVVDSAKLKEVRVTYDPERGDTLMNGVPFNKAYPYTSPPYAGHTDWYRSNSRVTMTNGATYEKYGLPLVLDVIDLKPIGVVNGIPVFADPMYESGTPDRIYFPIRPGCEFQPYNLVSEGSSKGSS